jgi:TetR/AcrR family transcriptional regulator, transcriptional repressor for nem operon
MGRCSDARARLIATGARLFHERGYTAVGVAEICDEAGLKKGSFYHFFESKLDLVLQAIDCYAHAYEEVMARAEAQGGSAREQLANVLNGLYEMMRTRAEADGRMRGCPIGNLALELADRDETIRERIDGVFSRWRGSFTAILQGGVDRGEIVVADPVKTAEILVAMVQGATLLAKTANDPDVILRLIDAALGVVPARVPAPAPIYAT